MEFWSFEQILVNDKLMFMVIFTKYENKNTKIRV